MKVRLGILFFLIVGSLPLLAQELPKYNDPVQYPRQLIDRVPDTIAGKSLSYYLNHPAIDPYAKLYVQRKFSPSDNDITFHILDSLNTHNLETFPFYEFVFHKIMEKSDGALSEAVSWTCANFIEKKPCAFFEHVKFGRYQSFYSQWIDYTAFDGLWRPNEKSKTIEEIKKRMTARCGEKYVDDFNKLVENIENYEP